MKHFNFLSFIALLLLGVGKTTATFADDNTSSIATQASTVQTINWAKYNKKTLNDLLTTDITTPKYLYLYDVKQGKFVAVGGIYGAQPILAEVGMYFYIEKVGITDKQTLDGEKDKDDKYYIHSWVDNKVTSFGDKDSNGDYLGPKPRLSQEERLFETDPIDESKKSIRIYIDRGKNDFEDNSETVKSPERVQWHIESTGNTNEYKIYSCWDDDEDEDDPESETKSRYHDNEVRKYYLKYYSKGKYLVVTTVEKDADPFYFIQTDDYLEAIKDQETKYINVSGLIRDARFERNSKGVQGNEYGGYSSDDQKNNAWKFYYNRAEDSYIFPNQQSDINDLAYMTAWIGPLGDKYGQDSEGHALEGQNGNYIVQEITGLSKGVYRVDCQGFYYNPNKQEDSKGNTSFVFASTTPEITSNSSKTQLKNIEAADWEYMDKDTYSSKDGKYSNDAIKRCLNAGKIFADNNPYEDKARDDRHYNNSVTIYVGDAGKLYIGAGKTLNEDKDGYVYLDNFQLFYLGDKQWYLDANNTDTKEFDITKKESSEYYTPSGIIYNKEKLDDGTDNPEYYTYPVTCNLRRHFTLNKWESLVLPYKLTGDQIKQNFGSDVKLSVYDNIDDHNIYFRKVNLDQECIQAGKFYIIQVTKDPNIKTKNNTYHFPWGNHQVEVSGPIYQIQGIDPQTVQDSEVSETHEVQNGYQVKFQGYYYKPSAKVPAGAYVVTKGDMYHLKDDWGGLYGTCWYLTVTDAAGNAKTMNFEFGDHNETTAIEGITLDNGQVTPKGDGYVYNLAGQRVAKSDEMNNLKAGIYIVNGKKILIR